MIVTWGRTPPPNFFLCGPEKGPLKHAIKMKFHLPAINLWYVFRGVWSKKGVTRRISDQSQPRPTFVTRRAQKNSKNVQETCGLETGPEK